MSIRLTNQDICSIDSREVQQKIISAISHYVKETACSISTSFDLDITAVPHGTLGQDLFSFAGTIDSEDLEKISQAVESHCEKIDSDEW